MIGIILFHALTLAVGLGIAGRMIPAQLVSNMLGYLHKSVGITTPSPEQVRMVAVIWIVSAVVMVDGCIFLLIFIARLSTSG